MRKWMDIGRLIWLAVCGVLVVAACGLGPQAIEDDEREAVLAYAEPATDNMITGLQAGDYAQFSRDLAPEMLEAMTEAQVGELRTMLDTKVGTYVSRTVSRVEETDEFIAVVYDVQFENEEHVTMRVVFDQAEQISGLWFDSPKLRE